MGKSSFHRNTKVNILHRKGSTKELSLPSSKDFLAYRDEWFARGEKRIAGDAPLHLDVETLNTCNIRCTFCPTGEEALPWEKKIMSFDSFKVIVDAGVEAGVKALKLNIRGEPLLHKSVIEMVRYARERGILDVFFNTNGLLLSEKVSHELIDADLVRISISVEGYKKETYEKYRKKGDFDKLIRNIEDLRRIKRERNVEYPQIRIQAVLLPELIQKKDEYVAFWEQRADEVCFLEHKDWTASQNQTTESDFCCPQLFQRLAITSDGTVFPCAEAPWMNELQIGNIFESDITSLWKGEKINQYRDLHKAGRSHEIPGCLKCALRKVFIEKA